MNQSRFIVGYQLQQVILKQTVERARKTMSKALEDAHLNRELVSRAFRTQLAALKLPQRPVIFYPNLRAAVKSLGELASVSLAAALGTARDAGWTEVAWATLRDAAREAARGAGWDAAWNAAWDDVWDAGWGAAWGAAGTISWVAATTDAWDVAFMSAAADDNHSMNTAGCFLELLRGGAFLFWTAPDAVHVVLAQVHTQKTQQLVETQANRQTIARLHREDGPAIQYEDGSGLYFWKGIQVPEEVILRPDEMDLKDILEERNAEVRRAMMERYGHDRFVLDAGAKVLDEWKGNELVAIDLPRDPDRCLVALRLRCPSTAAVYIIRVPPDQTTVQGALAWSFGLDGPEQYVLQKES